MSHRIVGWVPKGLGQALTFDNGTENSGRAVIERRNDMVMHFAYLHALWQWAANEQISGTIRRYFPKATDSRKVINAQVDNVVEKINQRPQIGPHYR